MQKTRTPSRAETYIFGSVRTAAHWNSSLKSNWHEFPNSLPLPAEENTNKAYSRNTVLVYTKTLWTVMKVLSLNSLSQNPPCIVPGQRRSVTTPKNGLMDYASMVAIHPWTLWSCSYAAVQSYRYHHAKRPLYPVKPNTKVGVFRYDHDQSSWLHFTDHWRKPRRLSWKQRHPQ